MKNLKRVLSLGLASVMLLGMMVVGASAKDFTDAEDITHEEAVQVLVALKVVAGKEDGSYFDPKGNVTRGEMAKMIAVVKMGGTDVNTGVKTVPSFTDIGGHWAEPYIEYCADMGIISGRGDGTFDPNGNVTGLEVTKMILTTLGYESKAYHLEGATWAAQTDELARKADPKLYKELPDSLVLNQPATRDDAVQIIWNGLQNNTRGINPETNTNSGEVTWAYGSTGKTLLKERYDGNIKTGTYNGNYNYNGGAALKGEINVSGDHFPSDMSIDNIGEEVKVIWKDGDKGTSGSPDKYDTIYGVFNTGATRVVRSQLSKVKDSKDTKALLNIDGSKYDTTNTVNIITNYCTTMTKSATDGSSSGSSSLTKALKFNSGDPFKAVFNSNGEITTVYVTTSKVAAVTSVNSSKIALNNNIGNIDLEGNDIEEGLKKGDVVTVTTLYASPASNGDAVSTVKKAEVASGEVTSWKDDENVVVNGKTYKINYKNVAAAGDVEKALNGDSNYKLLAQIPNQTKVISSFQTYDNAYIGKEVDLYLVNGYVGAAIQTSDDANNYSVITEVKSGGSAGAVFSGLQLQVMGFDGTKEIINVSKDSSETAGAGTHAYDGVNGITDSDYGVGDIITYSFDSDDNAEVVVEGWVNPSGNIEYVEKSKTIKVGSTTYTTTADCVLYVQTKSTTSLTSAPLKKMNNADWEAYDIRTVDSINKTGIAYTIATNNDGKVTAVFMNTVESPNGAEDNTVYGIVSAYNGRVKDYYSYTVQSNGEEYDVLSKDLPTTIKKGHLVTFRLTADGKYALGKVKVLTNGASDHNGDTFLTRYVDEFSVRDNTLTVFLYTLSDGNGAYVGDTTSRVTYALSSDCQIIYVDQDGDKSEAEGSIDSFNAINNHKNVGYILKNDGGVDVIKAMIVETSSKKDVDNRG